jgi:hypothetical protein
VVTDLSTGRVALIETGIPWRRTLAAAVEVLRSAEADLAYGFVKSGSSPLYVTQGESLRFDWPPRPDVDADRVRRGAVYEDTHAPDAFAVQLLGPGYAERVPDAPPYEATPVGESTLLEHADLAAWFEAPFVPPDVRWNQIRDVTPPLVLAEARVALAPILFRPPE